MGGRKMDNLNLKTGAGLAALAFLAGAPALADTELKAGPYPEKAGLEISGYVYSVPIGGEAEAPVVEVMHTDGLYDSVRDEVITFKAQYRAECGSGKSLISPGIELRDSENTTLFTYEGQAEAETPGLITRKQILPEYVPHAPTSMTALTPLTACNQIIQQRKVDGTPVTDLLRKGFWRKIDRAYETRLSYHCQGNGIGFHDAIAHSKRVSQPLYIHCIGDPDYGKTYAPTSTNTSTSSASRSDIDDALDKKRQAREALEGKFRLRGVLDSGARTQEVSSPMTLAQFINLGEQKTQNEGLRLADFEIQKDGGEVYYIGLWARGNQGNWFVGPKTASEFNQLLRTQNAAGKLLVDFEAVKIGGQMHYASLWESGRGTQTIAGAVRNPFGERSEFIALYNENKAKGIYPVDIEMMLEDGKFTYRAVWQKFSEGNGPEFMSAVTMDEFRNIRDQLSARGKEVVDIERVEKNGKDYVTALWANGSGDSAFTRPRSYDAFEDFMDQDIGERHIRDLEVQKTSD
jgi:hypothetical protein